MDFKKCVLFLFFCFFLIYGVSLLFLSVEAPRWRHVQDANVSGVSVPDAAWPLPPQQLRLSICKCTSALTLLLAEAPLMMVSCVSCCGGAAWGLYPRLCFNVLALDSSASLEHFSFYLVSSPNTEHMFLVFRGSFIWWAFWIIATAGAERHAGMEMFRARRVFCICGRRNQILSSRSLIKNKKENSDGKRWRLLWPFFLDKGVNIFFWVFLLFSS